ncbi:MAG: cation:proton antiporter [Candidatus Saganbacteria bacterium]|nr:cation:proton antiporter [Candidatus Saganbacteria bacterium]
MNGMTKIVKTVAKLVASTIIIFGLYLVLHGHLTPGGGFAGGVIIASAFILLTLAFGKDKPSSVLNRSLASILESDGGLILISIALLGFAGGYFFLNFLPKGYPFKILSDGIIPILDIAIGIIVAAALFLAFSALSMFRMKGKE